MDAFDLARRAPFAEGDWVTLSTATEEPVFFHLQKVVDHEWTALAHQLNKTNGRLRPIAGLASRLPDGKIVEARIVRKSTAGKVTAINPNETVKDDSLWSYMLRTLDLTCESGLEETRSNEENSFL